jgi:hypothetical protein
MYIVPSDDRSDIQELKQWKLGVSETVLRGLETEKPAVRA